MVQRSNYAAAKDVGTMLSKEECAEDMGQSSNCAAAKDAQTKPNEEEYVKGTGRIEHKMNLLHSDQN